MSFGFRHRTTPEASSAVNERLPLVPELFPSRVEAEQYLTETFTKLHTQEQASEHALRNFVLNNQDWSVHQEGSEVGIDTAFPGTDGEAFHIWVASESGAELVEDPSIDATQRNTEILKEADDFRVLYYSKTAMQYLGRHAKRGESLLAKVRQTYTVNPSIIRVHESTPRYRRITRDRMAEFYESGDHSAHLIPFKAPDIALAAADDTHRMLASATHNRARKLSEQATHHEEYRQLSHELEFNLHWEESTRQKIIDRLLEIQSINGYHSSTLNWRSVIPRGLDREEALESDTTWDRAAVEGLKDALIDGPEMKVLHETLRVQAIAAQALKALNRP